MAQKSKGCRQRQAKEIVCRRLSEQSGPMKEADIRAGVKPFAGRPAIYGVPQEPCWWFYCRWNDKYDTDGDFILRSSRIIAVSKSNGHLAYDGSACDEG